MQQRVMLVTGAASGIGRAVAVAAVDRGWQVAALDRDAAALETLSAEHPDAVAAFACDVADPVAVAAAFDAVVTQLGTPSGVFANAGIEVNRSVHELSDSDWNRVITVNLSGVFHTCRESLRAMLATGARGSIVCTSSPSAFVGFAGGDNGAYAASKGGISALVRSMALDYATHGIRVNAVVPGATDTPLLVAGVEPSQAAAIREAIIAAAADQIPLGRLARPDEIADAVLWLLSDESSYVTGSHLICDGGLMAKGANTF